MNAREQVRQRLHAFAWWRQAMQEHPGGLVPRRTAARMLGVSPSRIGGLIEDGTLRVVRGMPGAIAHDDMIPVDDLMLCGCALFRGRPGLFGQSRRDHAIRAKTLESGHKSKRVKNMPRFT